MVARHLFLAADLRARRLWLAVGWALVLLVIFLSLIPTPVELPIAQGDKFSHTLAYFALMSWFANLYQARFHRAGFAIGFVFMGVTLEFVQPWTGYRSFEVADMAATVAGVSAGWALAPPRLPNYLRFLEDTCKVGTNAIRRKTRTKPCKHDKHSNRAAEN